MIGLLRMERLDSSFWVCYFGIPAQEKNRSWMNEETAKTTKKLNQRAVPAGAPVWLAYISRLNGWNSIFYREALKTFGLRKCAARMEDVYKCVCV